MTGSDKHSSLITAVKSIMLQAPRPIVINFYVRDLRIFVIS
jgi:hypothetical protein